MKTETLANAALKLALEALEEAQTNDDGMEKWDRNKKAITAIKAALAQDETSSSRGEQEPVAWMDIDEKGSASGLRYWSEPDNRHEAALYILKEKNT